MRYNELLPIAGVFALMTMAVTASPIWPVQGSWTPITVSGSPYVDLQGAGDAAWSAPNPDQLDLVGGTDANGAFYPTAYWATDGENLMFRIRADNPYDEHKWTYTALLNTDADDYVDYLLQWDDKTDDRVEMSVATGTPSGPASATPWGGNNNITNNAGTQVAVGPEAIWARGLDATVLDGSQFHSTSASDNDAFIDFAVPIAQFLSVTGMLPGQPFSVAFGTSASHIVLGADKPDGGWSDAISVVPEPGTSALLLLAMGSLLLRRRRSP